MIFLMGLMASFRKAPQQPNYITRKPPKQGFDGFPMHYSASIYMANCHSETAAGEESP